jgi:cytochrome b involved in lipid metabolism
MDVSDWLDEHPGGPQAIMNFMGRDATEEFEMLHDDEVSFYHFANLALLYPFRPFPSTPQTIPH